MDDPEETEVEEPPELGPPPLPLTTVFVVCAGGAMTVAGAGSASLMISVW